MIVLIVPVRSMQEDWRIWRHGADIVNYKHQVCVGDVLCLLALNYYATGPCKNHNFTLKNCVIYNSFF